MQLSEKNFSIEFSEQLENRIDISGIIWRMKWAHKNVFIEILFEENKVSNVLKNKQYNKNEYVIKVIIFGQFCFTNGKS